jgi:signal transduction histidine kinase
MAFYNEEIDEEIIKDFVKDSMLQIQYMSKTLKDFRNFLKPSLKKAYFDIKIAISDVLELVDRQVYYHNINLSIDYGLFKGEVLILGYENEFKQVLLNIINNAKKKIVAKNSLLKEEKKIEISICVHEEIVQMKIKDSAGGINSHIKDHMFDPYFTTTKNGTGLGLYMAKVIIEDKMGGSIRVESEDESVSFLINMPRNISSSLLAKDKLN